MVHVTRSFEVPVARHAIVEYLSDFTNAEQWDPGTVECVRLDDGPIAVGSAWHNVSRIMGRETELRYELVELRPDGVVFEGRNASATSRDDIRVEAQGTAASRVTYDATITLSGLARLLDPAMQWYFGRLADDVVRQLSGSLTRARG